MLSTTRLFGGVAPRALTTPLLSPGHPHSRPALSLSSEAKKRKFLFEKSLNVKSFGGSLWAESTFPLRVGPIGALEYPNLDRAFLRLTAPADVAAGLDQDGAKVDFKVEGHKLTVKNENVNYPLTETGEGEEAIKQEIQVPMVYNVNAETTGNSSVKVRVSILTTLPSEAVKLS